MKKYRERDIKKTRILIIDFMAKQQDKFENKSMSVYILRRHLNIEGNLIYQALHSLLSDDIIEKVYISECPLCDESDYFMDENEEFMICSFCGEFYCIDIEAAEEEFRIKRRANMGG
jgi:Fe2+ or Zn2+ uptake regulation protein